MTWHGHILDVLRARDLTVAAGEHYLVAQCDHATLAAALREAGVMVDALIVDAPYSERTHSGHDDAQGSADRMRAWVSRNSAHPLAQQTRAAASKRGLMKRPIDYAPWSGNDVDGFVTQWALSVRGWICSLTDHLLAPAWAASMDAASRYAFSPIACVEPGSRVRMSGDGPAQWSTWLVSSRPRTREWQQWGSLPGAYVVPTGQNERKATDGGFAGRVVGGKPLWLMRAIVGDYSAHGDLVCDPCMGAGTTLVAAVELGRRAIGCEPDAGRFEVACKRLAKARPQLRMRLDVEAVRGEQSAWAMPRTGGDE